MEENKVFDWDDEITNDGEEMPETVLLPEGNYPFSVVKVEKAWHDASDKIPGCNMAKVFMRIDGGDKGVGFAAENIYLCSKFEWKAASFLRSIGEKKHGEPISWKAIPNSVGLSGRCKIIVDTFTGRDGEKKQNNKIDKFFDKEEQQAKKAFTKGAF